MHSASVALFLAGAVAVMGGALALNLPQNQPTPFDVYFVLRSYDSKMWHCNDGADRYIPDDAPSYKDKDAFLAYINNMDCPEGEKPFFRTLKDGSTEPDVLDDGNCWVTLVHPETKERHSYLVTSDGYHDAPANGYVESIEAVSGKNYVRKMPFQTVPLTWSEVRKIGARVGRGRTIDSIIGDNQLYKGPDFAIDFLFAICDEPTKAMLKESANNWPVSMQLLDNYYFEKHGASAFVRHGIPRGEVPARAHLSEMSVHTLDITPTTEPEEMDIYFVLRSYDSTMWHCNDGKDRKIPDDAPSPSDKAAFMDYINNMDCPESEKPKMRPVKGGEPEPDVLDDGNCWVTVVHPKTKERHAFLVSTDGYHDVRGGTHIPAVEDVSGKNYVKKLDFKTVPMTFPELKKIGNRVNNGRRVDQVVNGEMYKGSDFAIDFLMEIIGDDAKAFLRQSANNWPVSMQLLDNYYYQKHGQSAFLRHGIPRGEVPARAHLSTMSVNSLDVNPVYA